MTDKNYRIQNFHTLHNYVQAMQSLEPAQVIKPNTLQKNGDNPNTKTVFDNNVSFYLDTINSLISKEQIDFSFPTAILVFCSAKNPGGGILNGAKSQEEDISLHSTWFFQVKDVPDFYLEKGSSALNSDSLLFVKNGYFLTDEYHNPIEPIPVSFIGATAINKNGMIQQKQNISEKDIHKIMLNRIRSIFILAENNNIQNLVLGAFGCGVFGLEPILVASCFKQVINEGHYSGKITFTIPSKDMLNTFQNTIG